MAVAAIRKLVRSVRGIPLPILLIPCCIAFFAGYKYQMRLGYYAFYQGDYFEEIGVVAGYTSERRKQRGGRARHQELLRVQTSKGTLVADPQSLGYRPWWPSWNFEDLERDFPVGKRLHILVKQPSPYPVNYVHPFIVDGSYGRIGTFGIVLRLFFLNGLVFLWLIAWVDRVRWKKRSRDHYTNIGMFKDSN